MPALFDRYGISFAYPENWSLDDSEDGIPFPCVTVSSPQTAFWSLSIHSRYVNMEELIETAIEALRGEYGKMDVQAVYDEIEGQPIRGCEVSFCCLDLFSTAHIRAFFSKNQVFLLLYQAEDNEFEKMRRVFDAMTTSLLRG